MAYFITSSNSINTDNEATQGKCKTWAKCVSLTSPPFLLVSSPLTVWGLESEGPTDLEEGEVIDNPHPSEPMAQSEEMGHGAQPGWGGGGVGLLVNWALSVVEWVASLQKSWTLLPILLSWKVTPVYPPWVRAPGLTMVIYMTLHGGEEEDGATRRRRLHPKISPYLCPSMAEVNSGVYEGNIAWIQPRWPHLFAEWSQNGLYFH